VLRASIPAILLPFGDFVGHLVDLSTIKVAQGARRKNQGPIKVEIKVGSSQIKANQGQIFFGPDRGVLPQHIGGQTVHGPNGRRTLTVPKPFTLSAVFGY